MGILAMGLLVLWLIMGGVVAIIANSKGFDTFGWLFYGALIWPIALAHVIVKPAVKQLGVDTRDGEYGADQRVKTCPECAEAIKAAAIVCRYCGNRTFPERTDAELSENEAWFASLEHATPKPQPTTWQKLWWNPHATNRRR